MQPVTVETKTPASVSSASAAAATESYRTGFANPMFEETVRRDIHFASCHSHRQGVTACACQKCDLNGMFWMLKRNKAGVVGVSARKPV